MKEKAELYKLIPSVDEILNWKDMSCLLEKYPRSVIIDEIREYLEILRANINKGKTNENDFTQEQIIENLSEILKKEWHNKLRRVVNATGVVLHTNLGRSLLSKSISESLVEIATNYSNLEMDVEAGIRGSRYSHIEKLICKLTGSEAALVVNNNAAAVMLILNTMAKHKEVIVSRGQLVEIGGSFRVPDVMEQSGATLVEVGTTNKTHLYDFENAITEYTGALLKVHTSNYKILGFTENISAHDMVKLGKKHDIPVIEDLGSGMLIDLTEYGLPYEPTVMESVASGMDIVCFSGDKMLGGAQAGIIVGSKKYIDMMKKNQLTRAFRIDKLSLAALEGTLKLYLDREKAMIEIPVLRMLTYSAKDLEDKVTMLFNLLFEKFSTKLNIQVDTDESEVGGGSMPGFYMPTKVVTIQCVYSIDKFDEYLRKYETPIITRIAKNRIILDVRTIIEEEYEIIVNAIYYAIGKMEV